MIALYLRRIAEVFGVPFAVSVLFAGLLRTGVIPSLRLTGFVLMLFGLMLIAAFFLFTLREFYRSGYCRRHYYTVNLSIYALFAAVSYLVYFFGDSRLYMYLFLPFKLLTLFSVPSPISLSVFHGVFLLLIFLVPLFAVREQYGCNPVSEKIISP